MFLIIFFGFFLFGSLVWHVLMCVWWVYKYTIFNGAFIRTLWCEVGYMGECVCWV